MSKLTHHPPVAAVTAGKPYLDIDESVQYLREMGLVTVTADTIRTHAYRTGKLPRPIVVGKPRRSYWKRADLDALLEAL